MSDLKNELFEQFGEFDQYLTHTDIILHPLWKNALVYGDKNALELILRDFGADLSYGYIEEVVHARARRRDLLPSEQIVFGVVIRFKERNDKWWIDNMMDISDIIRNTKNSIRATGMRLASNEDSPMHQAMMKAAERYVTNVEICVDMGEDKDLADIIEESK